MAHIILLCFIMYIVGGFLFCRIFSLRRGTTVACDHMPTLGDLIIMDLCKIFDLWRMQMKDIKVAVTVCIKIRE